MKWWRKHKPNRKREAAPPFNWRKPARVLAVAAVVALAGWGLADYLERSDWERFRTLEVTGELNRVPAADVSAALRPHLDAGFARIDIRATQRTLEAHPWIAEAAVRRKWPGTLVVELREERPVATWFGTALMNGEGKVFIDGDPEYSGTLPDVGGPAGAQVEMIRRLRELGGVLDARGLELRRLVRSERRAERLWLANGIEVRLGRRDTEARLHRFLQAAWPALQAQATEVAYVDMRYTNGFAVGWKPAKQDGGRGERSNVQENG